VRSVVNCRVRNRVGLNHTYKGKRPTNAVANPNTPSVVITYMRDRLVAEVGLDCRLL
jgi:hypothetical protein